MAILKKNKFWIASFLLIAAMIGTWFYATGKLQAETEARVNAIKSSVGKTDGVMAVSAEEGTKSHPNQATHEGMQAKIDKLSQSVLDAWKIRYEAQQGIMKWPEEILHGRYGAEFIRQYNKYNPPETLPPEEKGQKESEKRLLRIYQQQIPIQMKNISAIIQSDWQYQEQLDEAAFSEEATNPELERKQPLGTNDDESEEDESTESDEEEQQPEPARGVGKSYREIVKWSETNQALWYNKLTSFLGRDDNEFQTRLPSPSQVFMLQQDLWLLEAMFDIIRTVNAQVDENGKPIIGPDGKPKMVQANDLAPVKRIDHVVFGREALSLLGEITETTGGEEAGVGGGRGLAGPGRRGGGRGAPGGRGGGSSSVDSDLHFAYRGQPAFHGRYVNSNLKPIEADKIRNVLTSKTLPAENLELVVAKRVPVRLAVQMDERKIPDFLAACANSPFAFEVWQVRINKHDPEEVIKLRGSEGGDEGAGGPRDRLGGGQVKGFGAAPGRPGGISKSKVKVAVRKNYDVGVEFYGIVKIYNPPNETLLNGGEAAAATNP